MAQKKESCDEASDPLGSYFSTLDRLLSLHISELSSASNSHQTAPKPLFPTMQAALSTRRAPLQVRSVA